jgi:iron(III) transport system permease protein
MNSLSPSRKGSFSWLPVAAFAFFGLFLIFPLFQVLKGGFYFKEAWTPEFLLLLIQSPFYQKCLLNSLLIGTLTTTLTLAIAFPLAWIFQRHSFAGKPFFYAILLSPLIYPPFVSASAIKQLFAKYGTLNLLFEKWGWITLESPIDFLGGASWTGILLISVLHAIPVMFLALQSTLGKIDPTLLQASLNLGANPFTHWRRILIPLAFPGIFAGCTLVFIGAFTDLGAPLMFEVQATIPTQIFNQVTQPDQPLGYLLVTLTLGIVVTLFSLAQKFLPGSTTDFASVKATFHSSVEKLPKAISVPFIFSLLLLSTLILLPLAGTILISFSKIWFMTPLPSEWSSLYWKEAFEDPLIRSSFQNSLTYSLGACGLNLVVGLIIAFSLARLTFIGKGLLRILVLIPMALPGIVLAFAYWVSLGDAPPPVLKGFWKKWVDPREAPLILLILSYAMHRITFVVQLLMAGYAQVSLTLEQAAQNLGASPLKTFRKITLPLLSKSLSGGLLLVFAFSMLEVSSGMILAQESRFYPISKAIYSILGRIPPDAPSIASALGILCVTGVGLILWIANRRMRRS